jgi:hypothetical protein
MNSILRFNRLALIILLSLCLTSIAWAQANDGSDRLFDFWVGSWVVTWTNSDGTTAKGKNKIERTLDGKVLQENFTDEKGFKGTSISVYNPTEKKWHQAWADNQGGYFNFIGEVEGDKRIFRTPIVARGDQSITQRMVFYNIKHDSMTWDWEKSADGGKTWELQWRILYTREH